MRSWKMSMLSFEDLLVVHVGRPLLASLNAPRRWAEDSRFECNAVMDHGLIPQTHGLFPWGPCLQQGCIRQFLVAVYRDYVGLQKETTKQIDASRSPSSLPENNWTFAVLLLLVAQTRSLRCLVAIILEFG